MDFSGSVGLAALDKKNPIAWNSRDLFLKPRGGYDHESALTSGVQGKLHRSQRWRGRVRILDQGTIGPRQDGGLRYRERNVEGNSGGQKKN